MLCLRRLIYSCFVFCAFIFTSCFFLSSPSYATSQSFTYDSVNNPITNNFTWTSSVIGFKPRFVVSSGSGLTSSGFVNTFLKLGIGSNLLNTAVYVYNGSYSFSYEFPDVPGSNNYIQVSTYYLGSDYNFTLTFYDSVPSFEPCDCPELDPCPEIPDDSQTLVDIKKAIYFIPAVLLVIYFFYIMYSWYIRS